MWPKTLPALYIRAVCYNKNFKSMPKKESATKTFILRVDAATMDAVEKWAADEFRSINGQLQWIIAEALRKSGRLPKKSARSVGKNESGNNVV